VIAMRKQLQNVDHIQHLKQQDVEIMKLQHVKEDVHHKHQLNQLIHVIVNL
jgi:hypothetical protein